MSNQKKSQTLSVLKITSIKFHSFSSSSSVSSVFSASSASSSKSEGLHAAKLDASTSLTQGSRLFQSLHPLEHFDNLMRNKSDSLKNIQIGLVRLSQLQLRQV